MPIAFATLTDYDYLAAHDHHVSPEVMRQKIERGEVIMLYTSTKTSEVSETSEVLTPIGWLRFNFFWDEIPFMNLIYIDDAFRGQGHGTRLIRFWEVAMRQRGHTQVLTSSLANERAQHLYRRLGYQDCGGLLMPGEAVEIIFYKRIRGLENSPLL
jgi:GNAT superfamily N-acetyltransferase